MSKSYELGFSHGNNSGGTNNYRPANRKVGGQSLKDYGDGFSAGMAAHHEATRMERRQSAWLNQPKATRGERPE